MSLAQAVHDALPRHAAKVVARDAETQLSAAQLLEASRAAAAHLARLTGAQAVGLLLPSCAAYPAALLGTLWAGKVAVPLNTFLKTQELGFLLQDAGIDTVVVSEATRPLLTGLAVKTIDVHELIRAEGPRPDVPARVDADSPAVMLYTSGTSGKPKGVPLSHTNLLSNAQALISRAGLDSAQVFLGALPVFHAFGLTGSVVVPLLLGAETTFLPRFSPERAASAIAERGVTVLLAVPGMFGLLARSKASDDALRTLALPVSGGEALPTTHREGFHRRFGRDLFEGYGLTETSPVIAVNIPGENRPGTVGKTLPGVEVRIAADTEEVQVRGPSVMKGYHLRPEENAGAFTVDGWFRTGDMGRLDGEGYLSITGRIKELIIRGGEKVMPREVEEVLSQCPGVQEAAVIGEPDGDRGEAVVAFVVPATDPPPSAETLRDFCRGRLAEFKVPRRYVIARDLPRGPTGKIFKRALRDWSPS